MINQKHHYLLSALMVLIISTGCGNHSEQSKELDQSVQKTAEDIAYEREKAIEDSLLNIRIEEYQKKSEAILKDYYGKYKSSDTIKFYNLSMLVKEISYEVVKIDKNKKKYQPISLDKPMPTKEVWIKVWIKNNSEYSIKLPAVYFENSTLYTIEDIKIIPKLLYKNKTDRKLLDRLYIKAGEAFEVYYNTMTDSDLSTINFFYGIDIDEVKGKISGEKVKKLIEEKEIQKTISVDIAALLPKE